MASVNTPTPVTTPTNDELDNFIRLHHGADSRGDANLGRAHTGEMTYQQIADHLGVSRETVRRATNRVLFSKVVTR